MTEQTQRDKFEQAARALECDESEDHWDDALRSIVAQNAAERPERGYRALIFQPEVLRQLLLDHAIKIGLDEPRRSEVVAATLAKHVPVKGRIRIEIDL